MAVRLKPIVPKKNDRVAKVDKAINKAVLKTLQIGAAEFKKTTRSWNTKVDFVIDGPKGGRGSVGTNNDIYMFVTRGTKPHLIRPLRARALVWEAGVYKPKTNPGVLGSRSKGAGLVPNQGVGQAIFARLVHHPGTKARGFEGAVAKRLQPVLVTQVTAAILSLED